MNNKKSEHYVLMLIFSFSIAFILHLLLFVTAPLATVLMQELDLTYAEFGFIFSAAMLSLVFSRIPWGLISDRAGYLKAFKTALLLTAVAAVLRSFTASYLTLLLSQILLGVGLGAIIPGLTLMAKEWADGNSTGFFTGIYVAGFAAGNAAALGITPYLLRIMDWREIMLAYSVLAVLICGLWWKFAVSNFKKNPAVKFGNFTSILKDRYVWVLLFLMLASMGSYDTLATWMPKFLETEEVDKVLATLLPLGFFLAGPVVGFISDRMGDKRKLMVILGVAATLSIVAINYVPSGLLFVFIFLAGFVINGVLTITLAALAEHKGFAESTGGVVGFVSALGNVGPVAMPVLFGLFIDITGAFSVSLFFVAAVSGIVFVLSARFINGR
ncbi:MFS transporter [Dehalococcoidia bacterium]|nr:MFS transporter [Dehalococcoidia bacterium]